MFRVIKISITMYSLDNIPSAGHKIKYTFENENGDRKVRVIYTNVDKCLNVVNKIVGRPFVDRFLELGFPPVVDTNDCFMRITYRLDYKLRR